MNRYEAAKDNVSQGGTKWDPADYLRLVSEEEQMEEESTTLDTIEKKLTSLATWWNKRNKSTESAKV